MWLVIFFTYPDLGNGILHVCVCVCVCVCVVP